jgi:hypothetical protein
LFLHLALRYSVVPLGLYRDHRLLAAPLPYVYTNPPMAARVTPGDVVFVLLPTHGREL